VKYPKQNINQSNAKYPKQSTKLTKVLNNQSQIQGKNSKMSRKLRIYNTRNV